MRYVKAFGLFWYDFIVGDDWRVAVGVVIALTIVYVLAHQGVAMWWFVPAAVIGLVAMSVAKAKSSGSSG
jgi:hypothetical protein